MTKKELTDKLKELFAYTKKLSFFDVKLKDGSILRTDDEALNKGSKVVLISVDGVESPAPEGDLTSEDGSTINIKSGVVDAITAAAMPVANATMADAGTTVDSTSTPAAPATGASTTPDTADNSDIASLMDCIKNLTDRVAALESATSDTKMTVEKMAAQPAAKPFNFSPMDAEGTIGGEIAAYKAAHLKKESERKMQFENFAKTKKPNPEPLQVNGALAEKSKFKFNFGAASNGFSIDNK